MTRDQFSLALIIILIFGVLLIFTFKSCAGYKPIDIHEKRSKKNLAASIIFAVLALIQLFSLATLSSRISYPLQMDANGILGPDQIIRSSSSHMLIGYATFEQSNMISSYMGCFLSFALAAYFFYFKKSSTTLWKRLLKVLYMIILSILFFSVRELHYFDIYELIWPIIFAVLCILTLLRCRKSQRDIDMKEAKIDM